MQSVFRSRESEVRSQKSEAEAEAEEKNYVKIDLPEADLSAFLGLAQNRSTESNKLSN